MELADLVAIIAGTIGALILYGLVFYFAGDDDTRQILEDNNVTENEGHNADCDGRTCPNNPESCCCYHTGAGASGDD